ncbi:hypothetical protein AKJ52_02865 [candidate division MSBL1 archaeon SCGC-AAA382C18]|uniref:Uracil-DNA glycosylase-like domain-containing protein n=1 Tax=candidate division MSBL1 archaeon SCGC-AAA382C18 TaxID=1698281 RepID=A0A133VHK0_9EURY|nr:hypothetical protein AKJ52_02865 [candidate division MSBL1 archaeon SCGC-AAA382C18]
MKKGLNPILDENTEVLILGSFPGEKSLQKRQYYADPNNDFWKLIGNVTGKNFEKMNYDTRVEKLKENGIGLWDVYESVERRGSSDSEIKTGKVNDFSVLENCPNLNLICFNGKKATSKYEREDFQFELETKTLLSSSGANRKHGEERREQWESALSKHIN